MNLVVSILMHSQDDRIIEALASLLPASGRPIFADEVNPDWQDVYGAIELLLPPDELVHKGRYIFAQWFEVPYSALSILNTCQKAGADIVFVHSSEEPAAADENSGEDDLQGYCYLKVGEQLKPLTSANIADLLPRSGLQWNYDLDRNVQQIVNYLMS